MEDQYQQAIRLEEKKIDSLNQKEAWIQKKNKEKRAELLEQKRLEQQIDFQLQTENRKKDYLENKKDYLLKYGKQSILFGLRCATFLLLLILGLKAFEVNFQFLSMNISFLELLKTFSILTVIFFGVEGNSIGSEFFSTIFHNHGNIEEEISLLQEKKQASLDKQKELTNQLRGNEVLLMEIRTVRDQIYQEIINIRKQRNDAIEELLAKLDLLVPRLDYTSIDIQKILEKKID